ncbi:DUF2249 domain-containing protein [Halorubrum distributum]|uniref:DUF2249 domain-containing protein n=1 Tax=Halorubrum distributum JCM 13916 TaxID=1230455 RepID=M0PRH2_9EURY|nr:DUF2249 domain-containing protein [Halorubrum arcis]EMA72174.1 hypothetical protein C462_02954 [Halorubrum arcis JCM 13916]
MFVTNGPGIGSVRRYMNSEPDDPEAVERAVAERTDAPTDGEAVSLDVRNLGPPKPLRETLERVETLGDGDVLVQYNDRTPQFLFPRLEDRGFAYAAVDTDATDAVVTAIWPADGETTVSGERADEGDAAANDVTAT